MPYIEQEGRGVFRPVINEVAILDPRIGELNYLITKLLLGFVERNGKSYATLNAALGILSAVEKELYRKVVAPYEDEKCKANGEVF